MQFSKVGPVLGFYDYDIQNDYYVQSSVNTTRRFLYQYGSPGPYLVNTQPDVSKAFLLNTFTGCKVPRTGWMFGGSNGSWIPDYSMRIITHLDQMPVICESYIISGNEDVTNAYPTYLGDFRILQSPYLHFGRPYYSNSNGKLLYVGSLGKWQIGSNFSKYAIQSFGLPLFPEYAIKWTYGSGQLEADLDVKCVLRGAKNNETKYV